ncbi:hypothetical protein SAMN05192579_1275 [Rhodanobacter glycinis]|uniref:EexN family lipoprotein n=2 Tax=Rhodanobacter glycinis TaxID=582702 RepID=A0A1I4GI47_9GAMM|nr:hypothetical protein SAMN05192579_1275 [Rhodanobacter glycinis]
MMAMAPLAACSPKEATQSADWYKAHDAERTAMVQRCAANPGELAKTPNCINATTAANAKTWAARGGIHGVKAPTFGAKPKTND